LATTPKFGDAAELGLDEKTLPSAARSRVVTLVTVEFALASRYPRK
jgi:hypothetical protein